MTHTFGRGIASVNIGERCRNISIESLNFHGLVASVGWNPIAIGKNSEVAIRNSILRDLKVPKSVSFIHIPLRVSEVDGAAKEISNVADVYDVLGGESNVNFFITRDTEAGVWHSFLGLDSRNAQANRMLTDYLGLVTVMHNEVMVRLRAMGSAKTGRVHYDEIWIKSGEPTTQRP